MENSTQRAQNRRARQAARPQLMTLQDAAEQFGLPYTSTRDLILTGHLPRVTLGDSKRIWIRRADLERLINGSGR